MLHYFSLFAIQEFLRVLEREGGRERERIGRKGEEE
jgi:hypothetical protein